MGKEKIKDLSKHVTGHICSKCSMIYCDYSEELCQEIIDSLDDLMGSIIDVGKYLVRRIEQKYTEEDMINFASHVHNQANDQPGKNQLREWKEIVDK